MGVDYGYSIGYGVRVPDSALETWAENNLEERSYELDSWEILEELNLPAGLAFEVVGNYMSGDTVNIICVGRVGTSFDLNYSDKYVNFISDLAVTEEETALLKRYVKDNFGIEVEPDYYAAGTIS